MINGGNLQILFILYLIYSFLGWVLETTYCSIMEKKVVDRGFLIGPVIPLYGTGAILMICYLTKYLDEPLTLFVMSVVICSILEYLTSYIMEKIFNTRWWDYSNKKFNVNGRICLSNAVCFGGLGIFILYLINPFLLNIIHEIPLFLLNFLTLFLGLLLILDFIVSVVIIGKFTKSVKLIKKDSSNDISLKVTQFLEENSILQKRLVNAFPDVKASIKKLKEKINS